MLAEIFAFYKESTFFFIYNFRILFLQLKEMCYSFLLERTLIIFKSTSHKLLFLQLKILLFKLMKMQWDNNDFLLLLAISLKTFLQHFVRWDLNDLNPTMGQEKKEIIGCRKYYTDC